MTQGATPTGPSRQTDGPSRYYHCTSATQVEPTNLFVNLGKPRQTDDPRRQAVGQSPTGASGPLDREIGAARGAIDVPRLHDHGDQRWPGPSSGATVRTCCRRASPSSASRPEGSAAGAHLYAPSVRCRRSEGHDHATVRRPRWVNREHGDRQRGESARCRRQQHSKTVAERAPAIPTLSPRGCSCSRGMGIEAARSCGGTLAGVPASLSWMTGTQTACHGALDPVIVLRKCSNYVFAIGRRSG